MTHKDRTSREYSETTAMMLGIAIGGLAANVAWFIAVFLICE